MPRTRLPRCPSLSGRRVRRGVSGANQIHDIKKFHLKKLLHFLLPTMVVGCVVISLIILHTMQLHGIAEPSLA